MAVQQLCQAQLGGHLPYAGIHVTGCNAHGRGRDCRQRITLSRSYRP